jgi:hypothetical protein
LDPSPFSCRRTTLAFSLLPVILDIHPDDAAETRAKL